MAKYQNVFQEASKRFQNFKSRGFIPKNAKYAFQDFVNEVAAENRGESYAGAFTASAYEEAYGVPVDYYEPTSFQDVVQDSFDGKVDYQKGMSIEDIKGSYAKNVEEERQQNLVEDYKDRLLDIFKVNDFMELAEKYGHKIGFYPSDVENAESLNELLNIARKAGKRGAYFLFRNVNGRNRRTESDQVQTFESQMAAEINLYIDAIQDEISMNDF